MFQQLKIAEYVKFMSGDSNLLCFIEEVWIPDYQESSAWIVSDVIIHSDTQLFSEGNPVIEFRIEKGDVSYRGYVWIVFSPDFGASRFEKSDIMP